MRFPARCGTSRTPFPRTEKPLRLELITTAARTAPALPVHARGSKSCSSSEFNLKIPTTSRAQLCTDDLSFMKLASLVFLAAGPASLLLGPVALAANDPSLAAEVAALEKKLASTRDEVTELRTALAIARAETEAAETKARARAGPDSQLDALRGQVRVLERDLQSATNALIRVAADKSAIEAALCAAN